MLLYLFNKIWGIAFCIWIWYSCHPFEYDEIEKILAEHFGLDENDVRIHILDGCHCVAIMPDEAEEKEQEDG